MTRDLRRSSGLDEHGPRGGRDSGGVMKGLTSILPLAAVLLVVTALVWWLLDRGSAASPWLIAAILFAHGWVHLVFLLPTAERAADSRADNPFDMDRSWLIGRGADTRLVHSVGAVLAVVTFVAFAAAALAVLGWLIPGAWWTGLVFTGVAGSTMLLVLFFAPTLVLGFVINAELVALAIQTAWVIPR